MNPATTDELVLIAVLVVFYVTVAAWLTMRHVADSTDKILAALREEKLSAKEGENLKGATE